MLINWRQQDWKRSLFKAVQAGAAYFALIFAVGFLLGTIRVFFLVPHLGETAAVLIETPIILSASWFVCQVLLQRFVINEDLPIRLIMGAVAFSLLLGAELLLGIYGFGRSLSVHLAHYATLPGVLGLTGQTIFALFPSIDLLVKRKH